MKAAQWIAVGFGFLLLIGTVYFMFVDPFNDNSKIRDATLFGQYGDFIGGLFGTVFSALGFFLLLITLHAQQKQFKRERFENQLYEMIRIHRENISEQSYIYYNRRVDDKPEQLTASQRRVFRLIFFQFEELNVEFRHYFDAYETGEIYSPIYYSNLEKNHTYQLYDINFKELAYCDLLYLILFFGSSKAGLDAVRKLCKERYISDFYEPFLQRVSLKPKRESNCWKNWKQVQALSYDQRLRVEEYILSDRKGYDSSVDKRDYDWAAGGITDYKENYFYPDNYDKYYGGHQHRLGHYFQHLYLTVNFVNDHKLLDLKAKHANVKLIHAQMSTYEQVLLFLHSVSILGRTWELEDRVTASKLIPVNKQLITKYNLIQNIYSDEVVDGIYVSKFYPAINYEAFRLGDINHKRKQLEKLWK